MSRYAISIFLLSIFHFFMPFFPNPNTQRRTKADCAALFKKTYFVGGHFDPMLRRFNFLDISHSINLRNILIISLAICLGPHMVLFPQFRHNIFMQFCCHSQDMIFSVPFCPRTPPPSLNCYGISTVISRKRQNNVRSRPRFLTSTSFPIPNLLSSSLSTLNS
jgi:hypothetical protein